MDIDKHPSQAPAHDDHDQEATATAALMMLTHDRRGFGEKMGNDDGQQRKRENNVQAKEKQRTTAVGAKGMSVMDLLSS